MRDLPKTCKLSESNHPGFKSKFNNIVVLPLADFPTIRPLILLGNSGLFNLVVYSSFHDESLIFISILNIILYLNIKTDMNHIYINLYCVNCKRKTETRDLLYVNSKNNRPMLRGICTECGCPDNSAQDNSARTIRRGQFGADNSALDNSARQFVADNSAQNIILILKKIPLSFTNIFRESGLYFSKIFSSIPLPFQKYFFIN